MLTGQGNEEVAAKSIKFGAADYLIKQRLNNAYLRTSISNAISRSALEAKVSAQEVERCQFLSILVHDMRAPLRNVLQLGSLDVEEAQAGEIDEMQRLLSSQHPLSLIGKPKWWWAICQRSVDRHDGKI